MGGKTYLKNALLLTTAGVVLRLLGMVFRVMIAGRLGGEGMGLYQLILSFYMVWVAAATSGVNVASTRLAAQSLARGQGMAATLRGLVATAAEFGTAAMLLQTLLAGPVARVLLQDARAELALRVLAPSLPFMAMAGALRGCFMALRRITPNVVAQLLEQCIRMVVAMAALEVLAQWGAGYGCAAVLLGNTVSETISCLIMFGFAAKEPAFRRQGRGDPTHPYTQRELYGIVWPVEGSRMLAAGLQAVESTLIPWCLAQYCGSRTEAMTQYGNLKGMAMPLLLFPFTVLMALSALLMPEITRAHTKGDSVTTRRLVSTTMKLTGTFSVLAGVGFVLFGGQAAQRIYHDPAVGAYVRMLGFAAPFMYLESMVDGILKGLGEQLATFRYSLLDSVLRICATLVLLPRYGMPAFLGVVICSNLLTCGLNTRRMVKIINSAPTTA